MPAMADMAMSLWIRESPIDQAKDVKNTFSSWDACMEKSYCKWPAIVGIIIASLILLSIISCLVRCLCCGLECCCGCFKCFNACCDCCTPRKRGRDRSYRDEAPAFNSHNPYGGYQPPPAAPTYIIQQTAPPQQQRYEPNRQFASFDTAAKRGPAAAGVRDDALPAMPTWKDAPKSHVAHEEEEVEMDHLNYHQAQEAPMLAHQAPSPMSHGVPSAGAQTEGMGLYNEKSTHGAQGDLGDPYSQNPAAYGAAAVGGGRSPYQQHTSPAPPQQQYGGYHSPAHGGDRYASPPAHDAYSAPTGAAGSYYQHTASPPPSYNTGPPPSHHNYRMASPVSPTSTAAGLPAALTPGGGIQPAHQAHGHQDTGVTGGQYSAYQGGHSGNQGWREV